MYQCKWCLEKITKGKSIRHKQLLYHKSCLPAIIQKEKEERKYKLMRQKLIKKQKEFELECNVSELNNCGDCTRFMKKLSNCIRGFPSMEDDICCGNFRGK